MILLSCLECQNIWLQLYPGEIHFPIFLVNTKLLAKTYHSDFCAEQFNTVSCKENEGNIKFGEEAKDKV